MIKRIKVTDPTARLIVHQGAVQPRVAPEEVAQALGAQPVAMESLAGGSPLSLFALRRALFARLPVAELIG